jgi:hypothetical protein
MRHDLAVRSNLACVHGQNFRAPLLHTLLRTRAPDGVSPFVFLPCPHTVRSAYVKQPGSGYTARTSIHLQKTTPFPTPPPHRANTHTNFPPLRRALSPMGARPLGFQYAGPAGRGDSHTDRPFPSATPTHGTATQALLLPHPAASSVAPLPQRARPAVATATPLPLRHAPTIIPPLVTEPATGRPDTVTVTGLRRPTSRGPIR